jgi:disulfide bond formation protein DsbB
MYATMRFRPWLTQRLLFVYGAVLCTALMITALYMQHVLRLEPCPLCIFQRAFVSALGVVMLAGAVHDPRALGRRVYGVLVLSLSLLGVAVAGRHVWLQHLPADQVPECGPGLEYMLEAFPLNETLALVFRGSGECAEVQWSFLALSIPEWTVLIFLGLGAFGVYLLATRPPLRTL